MPVRPATVVAMFAASCGLVLFELVLTRLFAVVLFASFAHLALALALLGISLGALAQHLWPQLVPEEGLEDRLGWLALAQAGTAILAVAAAVWLPLTKQFDEPPEHFGERSSIVFELVDPLWFSVLLPILAVPFVVAGASFAGVFQRRKEHIGTLYAADLVGGAFGALLFVPLLHVLPAPDAVFAVALPSCLAAFLLFGRARLHQAAALLGVGVAVVGMLLGAMGQEVLVVRYAAGYSEDNVVETRWTPLTRLALHEDERGTYLLLDNTSASEVILDEETRTRRTTEVNRSLVYQLHDPPARVAVLAASAGPEVAVAQHFGFDNVHAIDIAPQIGDMVSARFPDSPTNPFVVGNTVRVVMDGRAAIAHAREPFDIIQMVHANLHSSAGLLANAWSPSLLETREAFETYLDHLAPGGTLSFGRGPRTDFLARSATAALRRRGVSQPARHIAYVTGGATVMLVKAEPFTPAERDRIESVLARARASGRKQQLAYDPVSPEPGAARGVLWGRPLMTDDRPYMERPEEVRAILGESVKRLLGGGEGEVPPVTVIYHALMIQAAFVAAAGLLLLILPALRRDAVGLGPIRGVGWGLGYVACLGYGYLAIETVLLHELVLFVGHPTYAITVVILAMLLSSGFGSWLVGRMEPSGLSARLRLVLAAILLLGAACTLGLSPLLQAAFFGLPIAVRVVVTGVVLFPLGALMGMPFPLALRILHPSAAGMVPWAWALNGWTSVVASLGTVLLARLYGYQAAMWVALGAYALAWLISGRIQQIGAERKTSEIPA